MSVYTIKANNLALSIALSANEIVLDIDSTLSISGIEAKKVTLKSIDTLNVANSTTIATDELVLDGLTSFGSSSSYFDLDIRSLTLKNDTTNVYINNASDLELNNYSSTQAGEISLTSNKDIYIIGDVSTASKLSLEASNIYVENAVSTSDDIYFCATNDIKLSQDVATTSGDITLNANGGTLSVSKVTASGDIYVVSDGSVVDLNGTSLNFVSSNLDVDTNNNFGTNDDIIETNIDTLSISSSVKGLSIDEEDSVSLPSLGNITGDLVIKANTFSIDNEINIGGKLLLEAKSSGDFIINSALTAQMISLKTSGQIDINSTITTEYHLYIESTASTVSIDANLDVGASTTIKGYSGVTQSVNISLANGTLAIESENGSFVMNDDKSIEATSVGITTKGEIKYDTITATNGISLNASEGDVNGYNSGSKLTATSLIIQANAIGATNNYIQTNVEELALNATTGSIYLKESDSVKLSSVSVKVNTVEQDIKTVSIAYDETNIFGITSNNDIVLDIKNGDLSSISDSAILALNGTLDLDTKIANLGGVVSSYGDLDFNATGAVTLGGMMVSVDGVVDLVSGGDTKLDLVQATNTINLTSSGDILDNNGDDNNFKTNTLNINTSKDFGASDNAIETDISDINFTQTISSLYIDEKDTITFPDFDKISKNIHISASSMNIDSSINRTNDVYLEAKDGDLVFASGVTMGADNLTLKSQGDIGTENEYLDISANTLSISTIKDSYIKESDAITLKDIEAKNFVFETTGAIIQTGSIKTEENTTITTTSTMSMQDGSSIEASGDVNLIITEAVIIESISGANITIEPTSGTITQNGTIKATSKLTLSSTDSIIMNENATIKDSNEVVLSAKDITISYIVAQTITLTSTDGDITQNGTIVADKLNVNSANNIIMGENGVIKDTKEVVLSAKGITINDIDAQYISITSTSDDIVINKAITSINDLLITSAKNINMRDNSTIEISGDLDIVATNDITIASIIAGNITIETISGNISQSGDLVATDTITLITPNDMTVGNISAQSINIEATNGSLTQNGILM